MPPSRIGIGSCYVRRGKATKVIAGVLLAGLLLLVGWRMLWLNGAAMKPAAEPLARPALVGPPLPKPYAKVVTFGVCEDYDKNEDLTDIAKDFKLLNELEVDTLRISIGWDDFEPARGKFDFAWLHKFADLAAQYGIKLRPYIGYMAPWASQNRGWNSPPSDMQDWYNFCHQLAKEMKRHPNVVSYEILNEENDSMWFGGSQRQYMRMLKAAVTAIRAVEPKKQILLGGLVWPDENWVRELKEAGFADYYDIIPFHSYVETWYSRNDTLEELENSYNDAEYRYFVEEARQTGKRIWVNEIGYSTLERSEADQANFICRAVAQFFASPPIEHICWYEIKDLKGSVEAIGGDPHNYHFGLTRLPDRKPKLGFYTLDMLTDLLDKQKVTPADNEVRVRITSGSSKRLFKHLFKLANGDQVLFIYTKDSKCTVEVMMHTPGSAAVKYELNNTSAPYPNYTPKPVNSTLSGIELVPGQVQIFKIVAAKG